MNENNRYYYGYENEDRPMKEDKCYPPKENKRYSVKEDKYYPMQEKQYYPIKESKHCPEKKDVKCCCKLGIKRAAEILGTDRIRDFINFNAAAFITDFFLVGTTLTPLLPTENDNLGALEGNLDKLNPCECDLLEISGALAYPDVIDIALLADLLELLGAPLTAITGLIDTTTGLIDDLVDLLAPLIDAINLLVPGLGDVLSGILTALTNTVTISSDIVTDLIVGLINALVAGFSTQASVGANADLASLCAIKAMAFEVLGATPTLQVANYASIKEALRYFKCKNEDCNPKCDDCCCGNGIISELGLGNLSGRVSLTAGSLVLQNVEILGCIGNALILGAPFIPEASPAPAVNAKIYVVCSESVQFIL